MGISAHRSIKPVCRCCIGTRKRVLRAIKNSRGNSLGGRKFCWSPRLVSDIQCSKLIGLYPQPRMVTFRYKRLGKGQCIRFLRTSLSFSFFELALSSHLVSGQLNHALSHQDNWHQARRHAEASRHTIAARIQQTKNRVTERGNPDRRLSPNVQNEEAVARTLTANRDSKRKSGQNRD